jgi:endonuclease/exonuclease/phosphatase family metal-dependent hydrolase
MLRMFLLLTLACSLLMAAAADEKSDVRVMSFNLRYGTAKDGENHWDKRKEFLVETIQAFRPDLLGTQETLGFQRDYLAEKLPEYESLGVGRDDGKSTGEMCALFYRRDRFEKVDGGHFWLSETPEKVGSKSWDSSLPRMVTWVQLKDRLADDQRITFFNTHFDHRGMVARLESAKLIRRKLAEVGDGGALVLTGDFNADEGSKPYEALFAEAERQASPVVDSFRVFTPTKGDDEGTFSAFNATHVGGNRIDWIGVSRDWQIVSAAIDRTARNGRTPSDHYPVTAILRWAAEKPSDPKPNATPPSEK